VKKLFSLFVPLVLTALITSGCTKSNSVRIPNKPIKSECPSSTSMGIACYGGEIKKAIEIKFPHPERFAGRSCSLKMHLERDGTLTDASVLEGDPALCDAALAALKRADLPQPPSDEVYQVFKNAPLDFKP